LLQTLISHRSRDRQPRRRRYQKHQRAGAIQRAFAGAKMVLGLPIQPKDQATAADLVASTPVYIRAATTLLQAGDSDWSIGSCGETSACSKPPGSSASGCAWSGLTATPISMTA
jgi:hypothetical protein